MLTKAESPDAAIDETNLSHSLSLELERHALIAPEGTAPASLSSGVLRVGPLAIPAESGGASLSADYDFRTSTLDMQSVFHEVHVSKFWSGSPPTATVLLHGTLDSLTRKVDASNLAAGLAAEAIARESERIGAFEADMRERAAFNRRLKAWRFLDRRDAEIAAYEAEQERLKTEEEHKRLAAEYLRASEEFARSHDSGIDALVRGIGLPPPVPPLDTSHLLHGAGARAVPIPSQEQPASIQIREQRRE